MNRKTQNSLLSLICAISISFLLAGCSGSNAAARTNSNGTLSFNKTTASVTKGSDTELILSLSSSTGIESLTVEISSSDTSIARVTPSKCVLASESGSPQSCEITVHGVANGTAIINATATGYTVTPVTVTVSSSVVPGSLSFSKTSESVVVSSSNQVFLKLNDSSGVSNLVVTLGSSNSSIATESPTTCTLSSGNQRSCEITVYGISNGNANITATAPGYTVAPLAVTVGTTPVPGKIIFSNTSVTVSPTTSTQILLSLVDSSGISGQVVNLVSNNTSLATVSPSSCTLSSGPTTYSCVVTIKGVATGSTTITATSTNYSIHPVSVTITPPTQYSRVFTFKNNCANTIWVGSTGGATNSLIHDVNSGSTSCGVSLPGSTCPSGSTCINAGVAGWICYFNPLSTPDNNYKITTGESISIGVPDSSYDPANDFVWSGNFFGRELCNESTGVCVVANCQTESGGTNMLCTTSAAPPATLAEITMLRKNPDSYDISIINGVNESMEFGSNNARYLSVQTPYNCGTAGSITAATSGGITIPASSWSLNPTGLPSGVTPQNFNWVSGDGTGTVCTQDESCSASEVCGYTMNAVHSLGGVPPVANYALTCGTRLGYWTAAQIWFYNESTATNTAPFNFATTQIGSSYNNGTIFACASPPFFSGYDSGNPVGDVCGCSNWDGIAAPTQACAESSPYWVSAVLPNITWLKQSCPSCYTYPYDDMSSSYTCDNVIPGTNRANSTNYTITFCPNS